MKKYPDVDTNVAYSGSASKQDAQTLILVDEIITFNKGSRAKRYLVGGGADKTLRALPTGSSGFSRASTEGG